MDQAAPEFTAHLIIIPDRSIEPCSSLVLNLQLMHMPISLEITRAFFNLFRTLPLPSSCTPA